MGLNRQPGPHAGVRRFDEQTTVEPIPRAEPDLKASRDVAQRGGIRTGTCPRPGRSGFAVCEETWTTVGTGGRSML